MQPGETPWETYGWQRSWPDGQGSVWTHNGGPASIPWEIECSGCDLPYVNYATPEAAMRALDYHIRAAHRLRVRSNKPARQAPVKRAKRG